MLVAMRITATHLAMALLLMASQTHGQPAVDRQLSRAQAPPAVDHHQHLFSPEITKLTGLRTLTAADLAALLDSAGIRRAVVLSLGYQYGNPNRAPIEHEYERVKAENDWTSVDCRQNP
jgi:hypothetical protein